MLNILYHKKLISSQFYIYIIKGLSIESDNGVMVMRL